MNKLTHTYNDKPDGYHELFEFLFNEVAISNRANRLFINTKRTTLKYYLEEYGITDSVAKVLSVWLADCKISYKQLRGNQAIKLVRDESMFVCFYLNPSCYNKPNVYKDYIDRLHFEFKTMSANRHDYVDIKLWELN